MPSRKRSEAELKAGYGEGCYIAPPSGVDETPEDQKKRRHLMASRAFAQRKRGDVNATPLLVRLVDGEDELKAKWGSAYRPAAPNESHAQRATRTRMMWNKLTFLTDPESARLKARLWSQADRAKRTLAGNIELTLHLQQVLAPSGDPIAALLWSHPGIEHASQAMHVAATRDPETSSEVAVFHVVHSVDNLLFTKDQASRELWPSLAPDKLTPGIWFSHEADKAFARAAKLLAPRGMLHGAKSVDLVRFGDRHPEFYKLQAWMAIRAAARGACSRTLASYLVMCWRLSLRGVTVIRLTTPSHIMNTWSVQRVITDFEADIPINRPDLEVAEMPDPSCVFQLVYGNARTLIDGTPCTPPADGFKGTQVTPPRGSPPNSQARAAMLTLFPGLALGGWTVQNGDDEDEGEEEAGEFDEDADLAEISDSV